MSSYQAVKRFLSRYEPDPDSECLLFTGCLDNKGYGNIRVPRALKDELPYKVIKAHRLAYFLMRGPLDPDSHIDHLCNVKACGNPYHLEQISASANAQRANITQWYGLTSAEQCVDWGPEDEDPWA